MAYRPMTARTLHIMYGVHESGAHLQYHGRLGADAIDLPSGAVVHIESDKKLYAGIGSDKKMPMLLFSNPAEPDVQGLAGDNAPDPSVDVDAWVGIGTPGEALAFPCSGGFELVSTCFVDNNSDSDYAPNTPLTADKSGSDKGKLQPGTMYTDTIVGLTSQGVIQNGYGYDAVAFWTLPIFPTA